VVPATEGPRQEDLVFRLSLGKNARLYLKNNKCKKRVEAWLKWQNAYLRLSSSPSNGGGWRVGVRRNKVVEIESGM
jgi:hypothetical protein